MSSALPWSEVIKKIPPTFSVASSICYAQHIGKKTHVWILLQWLLDDKVSHEHCNPVLNCIYQNSSSRSHQRSTICFKQSPSSWTSSHAEKEAMAKPWERRKDLNTLIGNRTANDSGIKITCMPHHIPIGQIHPHLQQTFFIRYHSILTLLNVPWSYHMLQCRIVRFLWLAVIVV